jgi:hypothetical protein
MLQMNRLICFCAAVSLVGSCAGKSVDESFFFDKPAQGRLERFSNYSLEDQYKIFRYGNTRIEPPAMELADPIAKRGTSAIPFLHGQLRRAKDDLTVRDILLIFQTMARLQTYKVKSNGPLMNDVRSKVAEMKNRPWGEVCATMLSRLEASK